MNPKLKIALYGLGVFAIYITLVVVLRLISGRFPEDAKIFGIFSTTDFLLGAVVAVVLTFSHERKKRL